MRSFFLVLIFVRTCLSISAQSNRDLREPQIEEYVEVMQAYAEQTAPKTPDYYGYYSDFEDMSKLLFKRYDELITIDFNSLWRLYKTMQIGDIYNYLKHDWGQALIHSWLNENQPDLSLTSSLEFETISIDILPRDFDNDGQHEYLFDVIIGEPTDRLDCSYSAQLVDYMIVKQNGNSYEFIETRLPWGTISLGGAFNVGELKIVEYDFRDLNADGIPEWLVLTGGETFGGPGMGYENTGELYILTWRDGQFIDLAEFSDRYPYSVTHYTEDAGCGQVYPRDISWEFDNIDNDPAIEIFQHQVYRDNWLCEAIETKILDWSVDDARYVLQDTQNVVDQTRQCLQLQAEEAMWAGDYTQAIKFYEQSFATDLTMSESLIEMQQEDSEQFELYYEPTLKLLFHYGKARLLLAYILNGDKDKARDLVTIQTIEAVEGYDAEIIIEFVDMLTPHIDSPMKACVSAYDYFTQNFPQTILGTVKVVETQDIDYLPENIGCDAPSMIADAVADLNLADYDSPVEALESLDLTVYRIIEEDFNQDGKNDWLIWLDTLIEPFLFIQSHDGYSMSRPQIDPYHQSDDVSTFKLPEESGIGIIYFYQYWWYWYESPPWRTIYSPFGGGGGGSEIWTCSPPEESIYSSFMIIWIMDSNELVNNLFGTVCTDDLDAIFSDEDDHRTINGGIFYNLYDDPNHPPTKAIQFIWDSETQKYIDPTKQQKITQEVTYTPPPTPQYRSVWQAYAADDYAYIIDLVIHDTLEADEEIQWSEQFLLALSLQETDQIHDAVEIFQMISSTSTDMGWSMLADLHIK